MSAHPSLARTLANNFAKLLPIVEAHHGKQWPVNASIYNDGAILYVHGDKSLQDSVVAIIGYEFIETAYSNDRSLTVRLLTKDKWEYFLDAINAVVAVERTDNRQSDWPTISDYIELISRTLSTGRDSEADR